MQYQFIPVDNLVRVYFTAPADYNPEIVGKFFPDREPYVMEGKWCGIQCSFEEWDNWLAEMINQTAEASLRDFKYRDASIALALELARFHDWQEEMGKTIFFKPAFMQ